MVVKGSIKRGEYFDSITLMRLGRELSGLAGVQDGAIVMGNRENLAILEASGLLAPGFAQAGETDLLIAVKAADETTADRALKEAVALIRRVRQRSPRTDAPRPRSLRDALEVLPDANLALISVAGRHAAAEARRALERGLHVMLFSDNVSLADEIALKRQALQQGLLCMGPDCGTAIVNGVPLGFANAVRRGNVGIVAAAGTGLQEVSSLICQEGGGVSQAIGTGGRDIKKDVGGLMFVAGMQALGRDPQTEVILLVAKPPHPDTLATILQAAGTIGKPLVTVFLGASTEELRAGGLIAVETLEEGALLAWLLARDGPRNLDLAMAELERRRRERREYLRWLARAEAARRRREQRYLRGLFSGGTFCSEAQWLLRDLGDELYANAPFGQAQRLPDALHSQGHCVVDLGEDEFTVGRPHPMIDFSLRNRRILEESRQKDVAVLLLDVVLGFGAHPAPETELVPVLGEAARQVSVICSVTGTAEDPQDREKVSRALQEAGAQVMSSNAAACQLAASILEILRSR